MQNHAREAVPEVDVRPLPDVILPSQFFLGANVLSSEQRLMLAVLLDAINIVRDCRHSTSPRKRKSFTEASAWIFDEGVEGPMSFDHVCDALGVSAASLRSWLSQQGSSLCRLRLKEAGRIQRVTAHRGRRIRRRLTKIRNGPSEPTSSENGV